MSERRTTARLAIGLDGRYRRFLSFAREGYNDLGVLNINSQGICFATKETLQPGSYVEMEVSLDNGQVVTLRMNVVWAEKSGENSFHVGARISKGSEFQNLQVKDFCDIRLSRSDK
jgi:hypothetical protein